MTLEQLEQTFRDHADEFSSQQKSDDYFNISEALCLICKEIIDLKEKYAAQEREV